MTMEKTAIARLISMGYIVEVKNPFVDKFYEEYHVYKVTDCGKIVAVTNDEGQILSEFCPDRLHVTYSVFGT